MKLTHIAVVLLYLLTGVRCSDLDFKTPDNEVLTLAPGEDFQVKVKGLPEPNKYHVILEVKNPSRNWEIQKRSVDARLTSFSLSKNPSDGILDRDIQSGETYIYSIGQIREDGFIKAKEITLTIPQDLIVVGTMIPKKDKNIFAIENQFRIFITKHSVLKTMGLYTEINVSEIYSEVGGRIETFADSDVAPLGEKGRPSGKFHLKAGSVTGPLTIAIIGERGGGGFPGTKGAQGTKGQASGATVNAGFELLNSPVCNPQSFDFLKAKTCPVLSYQECRWKFHPGVGGKGGAGGPGFAGYAGAEGGDTTDAVIEIEKFDKDLKIIFEPGDGGTGGPGGEGGAGGPGGDGGMIINNSPGRPCDPSPEGPSGEIGPKGPPGPVGLSGKQGKLIFNGGAL